MKGKPQIHLNEQTLRILVNEKLKYHILKKKEFEILIALRQH